MRFLIKKVLFPILILVSIFLLALCLIKENTNVQDTNYTLKAYKNTVALYNGAEIIKIYDDVVLNTLPEKDIYQFMSGVVVTSLEQAELYLEDYES